MNVRFHDPHPGLMGCAAPLPEHIRLLANQLSGTIDDLDDVLTSMQEILPEGTFSCYDGCVMLKIGSLKTGLHCWRVIQYDEISSIIEKRSKARA